MQRGGASEKKFRGSCSSFSWNTTMVRSQHYRHLFPSTLAVALKTFLIWLLLASTITRCLLVHYYLLTVGGFLQGKIPSSGASPPLPLSLLYIIGTLVLHVRCSWD
ncbi:uncharacterized protein EI90DRAFT_3101813 [Cantharellus anzutake]|uniref:uncharacterized protein n=1 Tax=Cantharellus anzutake TaxID=1750568 RepID=UPI00190515F9|nr:uncharacterized protein EI90DRAFT_3101813 [Cantharellus anzutake]KAF8310243.1 hypothetical protein EI90DRAFT_3101813 [Cantharellus anzutake]